MGNVFSIAEKICRYYEMTYVPLGMWSRLITRLIVFSKSQVTEVTESSDHLVLTVHLCFFSYICMHLFIQLWFLFKVLVGRHEPTLTYWNKGIYMFWSPVITLCSCSHWVDIYSEFITWNNIHVFLKKLFKIFMIVQGNFTVVIQILFMIIYFKIYKETFCLVDCEGISENKEEIAITVPISGQGSM